MTTSRHGSRAEPGKIKMVQHLKNLKMTTREERETAIAQAGHDTFLRRSAEVSVDPFTAADTSPAVPLAGRRPQALPGTSPEARGPASFPERWPRPQGSARHR